MRCTIHPALERKQWSILIGRDTYLQVVLPPVLAEALHGLDDLGDRPRDQPAQLAAATSALLLVRLFWGDDG